MASPSRVPLSGSVTAAAVALFALLASPAARASLQDEIQVYLDDIDRPGDVGLELHVNTTPSGRSTPDYPGAWIGRVESVGGAEVVLRVPAQRLVNGWRYRNQWLKVGGAVKFETSAIVIGGTIADLTPLDQPAAR